MLTPKNQEQNLKNLNIEILAIMR